MMTTHTKRDAVWDAALRLAETGKFDLEDVLRMADLDETSKRTARDVLETMTDMGHLFKGTVQDRSGGRASHPPAWCKPEHIGTQAKNIRMMEWSDESNKTIEEWKRKSDGRSASISDLL
jgi:hypothetical protein